MFFPQIARFVNKKLEGKKYVVFAPGFNMPILYNIFPESIESIEFGHNFDKQLDSQHNLSKAKYNQYQNETNLKLFPDSLKKLTFKYNFTNNNNPLPPGIFPAGLEELDLGGYAGNIEAGVLPVNLKKLTFGDMFNNTFNKNDSNPLTLEVIPRGLTHLIFGTQFNNGNKKFDSNVLPPTLEVLDLGFYNNGSSCLNPGDLPPNLKKLWFTNFDNQNKPITPGTFPDSLELLVFGKLFMNGHRALELGDLPPHLTTLFFGNSKFTNSQKPLKVYRLINNLFPATIVQELVIEPYIYFINLEPISHSQTN